MTRNRSCSELGLIILEKTKKTLDLFDQALIGCLFINETGLIREANFTAALFLGVEMESLINTPISALMDPQFHETFCRHQEETYLSGAPRTCDLTLKRRDGTMANVRLQSIATECIGERAIRTALIDITDLRRAEEKATRQKVMLQGINRIFEEVERGGSDRALGETCLAIAKEITGSTFGFIGQTGPDGLLRDIAITSPGAEFCTIRDRAGHRRAVDYIKAPDLYSRVLRDGESVLTNSPSEHHTMVSGPAGYPLLKTFLGVPLIREGRTIGIIAVGNRDQGYTLHDQEALETLAPSVVEAFARREAEKALRKARVDLLKQCVDKNRALLKEAYDRLADRTHGNEGAEGRLCRLEKMEALGGLAGAMAHNFNNILAAVIGFTELAVENVPAQSMEAEFLGKVLQAGCRGRDLIQQMLLFSGRTRGESKPVHLGSVVKEAMQSFSSSAPPTICIRTKIPSEQDLTLADPEQIQQVVLNLCDNAAYAMREAGGIIDVHVSAKGEPVPLKQGLYMRLTVRDTGPGIAPENLNKIFDPFFTTKPPSLGVGLGLSVVQSIVHHHGGQITVKSEPGRGTIFTVYFQKTEEIPVRDHLPGDVPVSGHLESILFVDDEEMIAEIGRQILERLGYRVVSATSSRKALSIFKENPSLFDFVITDQTMPDMTGLDLAREILKLRPDIPIVLCTGFSQFVDADTAQRAGVRAFAMKPLAKDELARTIRSVLDG